MFPDKNEFLKYPKMKEDQEKLKQFMGMFIEDGKALDPKLANYLKTTDPSKFLEETFVNDKQHPTDPKRSKMKDLYAFIDKLHERMDATGVKEFDPREMKHFLRELSDTYDSPFRNDKTDDNFDAYVEKQGEKFSQLEEKWEEQRQDFGAEYLDE